MQMSSWQKMLSNILLTDPVFLIRRKKFNLYVLLKATILSSIMLVQFETPCCYNLIWLFLYKAEVPSPVEAFQLRNEYIIIVVYLISGLSIIIGGFLQNQSGFSYQPVLQNLWNPRPILNVLILCPHFIASSDCMHGSKLH